MAEGLPHAPDLTVASFGEGHLDPSGAFVAREDAAARRPSPAAFKHHTALKASGCLGRDSAAKAGSIHLLCRAAPLRHSRGEIGVVGEEKEPRGVGVQTADSMYHDGELRQEIVDRRPAFGIARGSNVTYWLVEGEIHLGRRPERLSVDSNRVAGRVTRPIGIARDSAVNRDATGQNPALGFGARGEPVLGEPARQAVVRRSRPLAGHCRQYTLAV